MCGRWDGADVEYQGVTWATRDARGIDRIYPGPDGVAMYRGEPVATVEQYEAIPEEQRRERDRIKQA